MSGSSSEPSGPELAYYEYEGGPRPAGPSGGQLAFDLLFGIVAPLVLLVTDPAVFSTSVARRAALPPYWALPAQIAGGCVLLALVVWILSGMRHRTPGVLVAGPLAIGGLLALGLGAALLDFAFTYADTLSGLLAFTPWLTAFVYLRQSVRAARAATQFSIGVPGLVIALGFLVPLMALAAVGMATHARARQIEEMLLSSTRADHEAACAQIRSASDVDFDRIAIAYDHLTKQDPRRPWLQEAYLRHVGLPIEQALERLYPPSATAEKPKEPAAPAEKEHTAESLTQLLFSADLAEHRKALDDLLELKVRQPRTSFDTIAVHYAKLRTDDPRRGRIAQAYRELAAEPIEHALKRLGLEKSPDKSGRRPKP